ncbi:MAG: type II toxin-antitoxin system VapC family toxin [Rhodoferax sp.]|nr:type II toxin-antitoxin system VapC family toxin [Rhodoferax sp.]MDP3650064.1 type II toxin-antitoxin system VapC family toxin [Rhodoferax sp.]
MSSPKEVLIGTDVLIWLARGNANASHVIESLGDWSISSVSYMEMLQGCRNKAERKAVQKAFKSTQNTILGVTAAINDQAVALLELYTLPNSLQMADALIAATALEHSLPLLTCNGKLFKVVNGLQVVVFKP